MILPNGTVIPHGILSANNGSGIAAFNRSYKNTGIKAGFVIKAYAPNDPGNQSQLCIEYDVQTIEQDENKGSTSIVYKNCISSQGFGGIGDFLEYTLRSQTYESKDSPSFSGQDGAIALIQCLDNIGAKAVVVGNLIHPDRSTTVTGTGPQLAFTYNGIAVKINTDGSFALTFNGATDSKGVPTSPPSAPTSFQIDSDGSYALNSSAVVLNASAAGVLNIIANGQTTIDGSNILLGKNATESLVKGNSFKQYLDEQFMVATALGPSGLSIVPMPPNTLSTKVETE